MKNKNEIIRILVGNKGRVDFSQEVRMDDVQFKHFYNFLNSLFEVVDFSLRNFREKRLGEQKNYPSEWSSREISYLMDLKGYTEEHLSKMLGRTEMAIMMQRAKYYALLDDWCKDKNISFFESFLKNREKAEKLIKKFLKEREAEKLRRRKERQLKRQRGKGIIRNYKFLLDKRKRIKRLINMGAATQKDLADCESKINRMKEKYKKILDREETNK